LKRKFNKLDSIFNFLLLRLSLRLFFNSHVLQKMPIAHSNNSLHIVIMTRSAKIAILRSRHCLWRPLNEMNENSFSFFYIPASTHIFSTLFRRSQFSNLIKFPDGGENFAPGNPSHKARSIPFFSFSRTYTNTI
jgi:hypothetical protein